MYYNINDYEFDINSNLFNILNDLNEWVRALDIYGRVFFINKKMCEDIKSKSEEKRDEYLNNSNIGYGLSAVRFSINSRNVCNTVAEIDGRFYDVSTLPVISKNNDYGIAIQIFRDITLSKKTTEQLNEKNKSMTEDLKFARNMQIRMLPPKEIYNGLKLDFIYEPSEILSGDMFDIFNIDQNRTGFYICDVVGHGVSASLLTMFVRQSVRTLARSEKDLGRAMKELHKMFLSLNLEADKYFSIFLGIYNNQSRSMSYVNAGHNTKPVLCQDGSVKILEKRGYPICNLFDNVEYEPSMIKLNVNDTILLYTDGIIEAKNNKQEEFGEDRLLEIVKNSENVLDDLYREIKIFSQENLKDDCALMLIKVVD